MGWAFFLLLSFTLWFPFHCFAAAASNRPVYRNIEDLLKGVERGHAPSEYALGNLYALGQGGLEYNISKAAAFYRRAARRDYVKAQIALARLYETGRGVPKSPRDVEALMKRAALLGDTEARKWLSDHGAPNPVVLQESGQPGTIPVVPSENTPDINAAVNMLEYNPRRAAAELERIGSPVAKAYLAYAYFTGALPAEDPREKAHSLISEALSAGPDGELPSDAVREQEGGYTDLGSLLMHLRAISDAAHEPTIEPPCYLFFRHPREAAAAFGDIWEGDAANGASGSSRCAGASLGGTPEIRRFLGVLDRMMRVRSACRGDLDPSELRAVAARRSLIEISPQALLEEDKGGEAMTSGTAMAKYRYWSERRLGNKRVFRELDAAYEPARSALERLYHEEYFFTQHSAAALAGKTLDKLLAAYLPFIGAQIQAVEQAPAETSDASPAEAYDRSESPLISSTRPTRDEMLRRAVLGGRPVEEIAWLVRSGANPNAFRLEETGEIAGEENALMMAVENPRLVERLIGLGARPNCANASGWTALFSAVECNAYESAEILLRAGANVNARICDTLCSQLEGENGGTPLMLAAARSSERLIRLLIRCGAHRRARDANGSDAYDRVQDNPNLTEREKERVRALLQSG